MTETEQEYFQICAWRYLHPLSETEYGEWHHILPKSCGGFNKAFNLVRLTPEEHYRCHALLPKIFEDKGWTKEKRKMVFAWNFVHKTRKGIEVSQEEYGRLRRELSTVLSETQRGMKRSDEFRKKCSEGHKGIRAWNKDKSLPEEQKTQISETLKSKNIHLSKERVEKMHKARSKDSYAKAGETISAKAKARWKKWKETNSAPSPWNKGLHGEKFSEVSKKGWKKRRLSSQQEVDQSHKDAQ